MSAGHTCSCGERYVSEQGRIDCEKSHIKRSSPRRTDRKTKALAELARELHEIVDGDDSIHVNCPFCDDGYTYDGVTKHEPECIVGRISTVLGEGNG